MERFIRKAETLIEALPYIQSFQHKIVVIKLGGSAMTNPGTTAGVLRDIVFMEAVKMKPVLIHGGGFLISERMKKSGITPRFVEGLRCTDADCIRLVHEAMSEINADLVARIEAEGGRAEGLVARPDPVIRARRHLPLLPGPDGFKVPTDIGFVGEIESTRPGTLFQLTADDIVPVIAPLGRDEEGNVYNINGDMMAGAVAAALGAEKLVFLTDVEGIIRLREGEEPILLSSLNRNEIASLLKEGVISGGMIPKVRSGLQALEGGVRKVHIIDGRVKHSLLLEIFTDQGIGTEISNTDQGETEA
ncbi:MAG TPA: acetylglutamate kinase [bacterium]|nr:acetylglutamate kinase [bacterium]HPQ66619.1 acetylglutamate kinase [bacterium]